jgi:uncharacterized membrane protein YqgA involved in biofilm formation
VRGLGTIVNVATVLAGAGTGMLIGPRIPERVRETALYGVGLAVVLVGVKDGLSTTNAVFPLVAVVIGGVIGELLGIEDRLLTGGERIRSRFEGRRVEGAGPSTFVEGFVSASLVFCVGPLTVLGSISDGLGHGAQELIVKAALDGIVAVVFASTLGIGVAFSALTVLVVQGSITAGAGVAEHVLTDRMVTEMTATGGLMIVAIGIRLLGLRELRVGSYLPALVIAPIVMALFAR